MNRFVSYPHDSLIYFFINLYLMQLETKESLGRMVNTRAIILSGAPYEKEIADGIIPLFDDLIVSTSPYKKEISRDEVIEDDELLELWEKIR